MEVNEEMVGKIRSLGLGGALKVNGREYVVVDIQALPEPGFELKAEKESREEGIGIYLAEAGKEIEEPPILSADFRLACVDYNVTYDLVERREGIVELSKEYTNEYLIVHDFENGNTRVYGSRYSKKDISGIKIRLLDLDDEAVELKSLEF
jgi:hypothetical protein